LKLRKSAEEEQRHPSCSKHGEYDGPYCPECYERAMSGEANDKTGHRAKIIRVQLVRLRIEYPIVPTISFSID